MEQQLDLLELLEVFELPVLLVIIAQRALRHQLHEEKESIQLPVLKMQDHLFEPNVLQDTIALKKQPLIQMLLHVLQDSSAPLCLQPLELQKCHSIRLTLVLPANTDWLEQQQVLLDQLEHTIHLLEERQVQTV